jgi:hypothetical protein
MGPEVRIDRLNLRIPGAGAESGRRLGEEVAARVAASLGPSERVERIGAIDLRVPGDGTGDLAERIAEAILRSLR